MYSDAGPATAEPTTPEAPAAETEEAPEKEQADESQTAELPKSVLGGKEFKPGEEVVLEVVQVMENSVLVKYASEKSEEEYGGETKTPEAAGAPAGGGMSSMME